jgi:hypothetical protein
MTITINGQLMLCMLAEALMEIQSLQLIQINTDGITIKVARDDIDEVDRINAAWEKRTKLDLERADYKRMFIKDCNNYIGEYTDGKLKRKGAYEYEIGWHQNHSSLVIQKAVQAHLIDHTPVEQFIRDHDDVYDFMLRIKVPKNSRLEWGGQEIQNTTRYFIGTDGKPLVKIMPPTPKQVKENPDAPERHFRQHMKGKNDQWGVTPMNVMDEVKNIDYDWYIMEAKKLIDPLYDGFLRDLQA